MDTRALGGEFFTKGRNPRSRNENSNTIYGSDPPHGSDGGAAAHSKTREGGSEQTAAQIARPPSVLSITDWVVTSVAATQRELCIYPHCLPTGAAESVKSFASFADPQNI